MIIRLRVISAVAALVFAIAFAGGCRNFGAGGTGELVVRERVLREIDTVDVSQYAVPAPPMTTQATTSPLTRPSTHPAPMEQKLTIEDVRRLALRNNLTLRVELINPAIARTTLSEEEARYEALFTANIDFSKFDSPTSSRLNSSQAEDLRGDVGVSLPLQTGGTVRFGVPVD